MVTSGEREEGWGSSIGGEDEEVHTIMCKICYKVKHGEYSQYFIITINRV